MPQKPKSGRQTVMTAGKEANSLLNQIYHAAQRLNVGYSVMHRRRHLFRTPQSEESKAKQARKLAARAHHDFVQTHSQSLMTDPIFGWTTNNPGKHRRNIRGRVKMKSRRAA